MFSIRDKNALGIYRRKCHIQGFTILSVQVYFLAVLVQRTVLPSTVQQKCRSII